MNFLMDLTNQDSFDEYKLAYKHLAKSPEDLLDGLEDMIRKTGIGNSFLSSFEV